MTVPAAKPAPFAIPLQLSGLVTPTVLRQYDPESVKAVRAAFARSAQLHARLPDDDITRLSGAMLAARMLAGGKARAVLADALSPMVMVARGMATWGAPPVNAAIRVTAGRTETGSVQIEGAQRMHIDVSALRYGEGLAQNRITLRALLATDRGPEVCDIADEADPRSQLVKGGQLEAVEDRCRKAGRIAAMRDGELRLMDMLTPHRARTMDKTVHRVLVDCAVTLQLPDDWKARVAKGDRPKCALG